MLASFAPMPMPPGPENSSPSRKTVRSRSSAVSLPGVASASTSVLAASSAAAAATSSSRCSARSSAMVVIYEIPSTPLVRALGTLTGSQGSQTLRSEEHTSELQSRGHLVCRLLLEKKNEDSRHHYQDQR